ncbi:glycosyl transferase family 1 [Nocardioides sp. Root1257]|uniref:glycogen synthase n=1 Tax=unclassified Nocardioides TaxID=2615069 RepID=UPI0006F8DFD8|nr:MULTISPECIES: glycogen synthase [unclassified Nocardioides]KQW49102.1 glycosyl transferase family 1 [Nocardioides sp. Root1257]KRC48276.1 glycosyl transferase family 1 [Nocardioides sp. Root224]
MRVDVLSREYPPEVYGGAGVHVAELVRALRARSDVEAHVHAFGALRDEPLTSSYADLAELSGANAALRTLGVDLAIADACAGTELVHSHTWYANFAGHLASLLHGVPHVVSAHSLEPLRPWKAEQLGGGYAISSYVERTSYEAAAAVIAVSAAMRDDVLASYPAIDPARVHVVHNGIDTDDWSPTTDPDRVRELGVDPDRPSVVFVGRITRQKGLPLFLRACAELPPEVQIVLCAGAPDTPEIMAEVEGLVAGLQASRNGVVWIAEMLPRHDVTALLTAATAFACPSIYEPLGIVNLEAMACETAVVATATGGIPEVVVHGSTGLLVPILQAGDGTGTPLDPDQYVADFAEALIKVVSDPARAAEMGRAGRERAIADFSWDAIAERTVEVYRSVL